VSGDPDPLYVLARRVLLDALEALGEQRTAIILVGAQAIYLHVGEADLAVAPHTTDGDLVVVPSDLERRPLLGDLLKRADFVEHKEVGTWVKATVPIDLLVPESLADKEGRRGARLGPHGDRAARKVKGLEAVIVDRVHMRISSLEEGDPRSFELAVAGPTALLVAKLHKVADRGEGQRANNKDALDVYRLLRGIPTATLASQFTVLIRDDLAGPVSLAALEYLRSLFARRSGLGARMVADALHSLEDRATTIASCESLATDLLSWCSP